MTEEWGRRTAAAFREGLNRPMTEAQLQRAVIELARSLGWGETLSARKSTLEEAAGYGVPAPPLDGLVFHPRYSLGSEPGWPDLTLIRRRDRRLIFAELKSEKGALSQRQAEVLELLGELIFPNCSCRAGRGEPLEDWQLFGSQEVDGTRHDPGCRLLGGGSRATDPRIEVHVWRPSDLASGAIADVLR